MAALNYSHLTLNDIINHFLDANYVYTQYYTQQMRWAKQN